MEGKWREISGHLNFRPGSDTKRTRPSNITALTPSSLTCKPLLSTRPALWQRMDAEDGLRGFGDSRGAGGTVRARQAAGQSSQPLALPVTGEPQRAL